MPNDYVHIDKRTYDASCISAFLLCPRLFQQEYIVGVEQGARAPLDFGAAMHSALLIWYKTHNVEEAVALLVKEIPVDIADERRTREHGEVILREYCKRYPTEPYTIKQSEVEFAVDMPGDRVYVGRIDQIVEWEGGVYVKDHKTTSQLGQNFFKGFRPSVQMDGYAYACRELVGRCDGVIINGISVAANPKERFGRDLQGRTPVELNRWGHQFGLWCGEIERCVASNIFPFHFTACTHWGRCEMWEGCVYGSEGLK